MYKYNGVIFTEEDIEKMAIEYIELTKEAGMYGGANFLLNSPEFQNFVKNFGGKVDLATFSQIMTKYMMKQIEYAKSKGITINDAKEQILTDTIEDCKLIGKELLGGFGKSDPTTGSVTAIQDKFSAYIDNMRNTFSTIYDKIIANQAQQAQAVTSPAPAVV